MSSNRFIRALNTLLNQIYIQITFMNKLYIYKDYNEIFRFGH